LLIGKVITKDQVQRATEIIAQVIHIHLVSNDRPDFTNRRYAQKGASLKFKKDQQGWKGAGTKRSMMFGSKNAPKKSGPPWLTQAPAGRKSYGRQRSQTSHLRSARALC
jgi:hypothetical protein